MRLHNAFRLFSVFSIMFLAAEAAQAGTWLVYYPNMNIDGPVATVNSYGGADGNVDVTIKIFKDGVGEVGSASTTTTAGGFWTVNLTKTGGGNFDEGNYTIKLYDAGMTL